MAKINLFLEHFLARIDLSALLYYCIVEDMGIRYALHNELFNIARFTDQNNSRIYFRDLRIRVYATGFHVSRFAVSKP